MATQTVTELQSFELQPLAPAAVTPRPGKTIESPPDASSLGHGSTTPPAAAAILSRTRAIIVIAQQSGITVFSSFCNGVIVVGLPAMAATLQLDEGLLVWSTSVFFLTAGSCLLMAGSVADVVGARRVNLVGALLASVTAAACGLARTGAELVAFRALQGITNAIIVPSSISIISTGVEDGRPRNVGFACLGFAGPTGFSLGLVLGGVLVDSTGWRPAFYLAGAATFVLFLMGFWALPHDSQPPCGRSVWKRLATEIDWVGAVVASTGLATLSYFMAVISADIHNIHHAPNIVVLCISAASVPVFIGWMHHQVKHNRVALIPNALWRSSAFTSCCIMVLFTFAVTNCMELFSSLFFQEVQGQSALGASLRVLPSLVAGALTNLTTGIFVNRMPVMWTVLLSSVMSAVAPLLMGLIRPEWPYWYDAFLAQILSPLSCDMLFTVGLLVVSGVFPKHLQGLSGAVFNTCAQLGGALGMSITSVISSSITETSRYTDKTSPDALAVGYRAAFWTMFGWMVFVCLMCVWGLRKIGTIGVKRD